MVHKGKMRKCSKAVVTGYPVGCRVWTRFSCTPSYPAAYALVRRVICSTNGTPGISVTKYEHHYQSHLSGSPLDLKRYFISRVMNIFERI